MIKLLNTTRFSALCLSMMTISLLTHSLTAVAQSPQAAINVDVIYPNPNQTNQSIVLTGTIEAKQRAQLAPLEAGRVTELDVEIGDIVKSGQTLLGLDNTLAVLEVQGAKAGLNAAEVNLQEANRLYKEVLQLSKQQLVAQTLISERAALLANAEAQLARAQATLSLQQELLIRHTLRAPFDGVIAQRNVDKGEWVTQQTSVLVLVAQSDLRLTIAIPQQYYGRLVNQSDVAVTILPDLIDTKPFNAKLSRFVPVSDALTRTFVAQVDLPTDTGLVVGMSARAQISLPNTHQSIIILPRAAIKQHPDGGSSVFVVENGKAKRVITSYTNMPDNRVAISNHDFDLPYIVSAVELLKEGTVVTPKVVASIR